MVIVYYVIWMFIIDRATAAPKYTRLFRAVTCLVVGFVLAIVTDLVVKYFMHLSS